MVKRSRIVGFGLVLWLCLGCAHASVVITGTRVVFPVARGEVTVHLGNEGKTPALVEAWIDRGNPDASPETVDVPFTLSPPIFRMEAGKSQVLRIVYNGDAALPPDRESLFWLNVLEVPPRPKHRAAANTLQLAVRSRLKLFLRPPGLKGDPLKAPAALTWSVVQGSAGAALEVRNPTPYHVTLTRVSVQVGAARHQATTGMVAPFGTLTLALTGLHTIPAQTARIDYTALNDYGSPVRFKGRLGARAAEPDRVATPSAQSMLAPMLDP